MLKNVSNMDELTKMKYVPLQERRNKMPAHRCTSIPVESAQTWRRESQGCTPARRGLRQLLSDKDIANSVPRRSSNHQCIIAFTKLSWYHTNNKACGSHCEKRFGAQRPRNCEQAVECVGHKQPLATRLAPVKREVERLTNERTRRKDSHTCQCLCANNIKYPNYWFTNLSK